MKNENSINTLNKDLLVSNETFNSIISILILIILLAFLLLNIVQIYNVTGSSMYPSLKSNDKVLIKKINIDYKVGDIVVFKYKDENLIKRIVAGEGDTIKIIDYQLYVNSCELKNTYIYKYSRESFTGKIPEGFIYLLGDNRYESYDSRRFGLVKENRIIGKYFIHITSN